MKQLVVIDGQGGGMGKQLIAAIKAAHPQFSITGGGHERHWRPQR